MAALNESVLKTLNEIKSFIESKKTRENEIYLNGLTRVINGWLTSQKKHGG